jgi:uncharacterized membrane-anchored protein YhcB (DUF1043 family)
MEFSAYQVIMIMLGVIILFNYNRGIKEIKKGNVQIDVKIEKEKAEKDLVEFYASANGMIDALITRIEYLQSKIKETNETITGGRNE